jgi:hypothetical protein
MLLFAPRPLVKTDKSEGVCAVCLHADPRHVNQEHLTNSSVRARFQIEPEHRARLAAHP